MEITTTIIGAGVVGLAVAAELSRIRKGILILERNPAFGQETSSRNSEVIHAGIYYAKDSKKAKLCVAGNRLLPTMKRKNGKIQSVGVTPCQSACRNGA